MKALSKPSARNLTKGAAQLLKWANSQTDHALSQRSVHLMRKAIRVVKDALPDTDNELIGGFFADLLDLWETGQTLDKELHNLTKLRFPRDRERLGDVLSWIAAIQVDMASYWIGEVKKDLPKLRRDLDMLENKSRQRRDKRKLTQARPTRKRKVSRRGATTPNSTT